MKIITCKDGISPATGIVLMLAVTVMLSAFMYSAIDIPELKVPVLTIFRSVNEIVPHEVGLHRESQIVKITSFGGQAIPVENIKIKVSAYRNGSLLLSETCWGFPVIKFGDAECSGDDFLDKGYLGFDVMGELHVSRDGVISSGEFIGFRIKVGSGGIQLRQGDIISVQVFDMDSGLIVARIERTVD